MIQLKNLTLRRGAKVILDNVTLTLQPGEKIALVGHNGAGKSSLFALLTGELHADGGDAEVPAHWRVAEVAQSMPETPQPATDFVIEGDTRLTQAQAALARAEQGGDGHAIADAHTALAEANAFDARSRAQALLMGLGFKIEQLDAPVNSFSGGWRMRLQLARALMCPADLLLLDEPTNHLDLDALVWLEGWLKRFEGTLLVISHDREFLDATTRVTLHLDQQTLTRYGGNYSAFEFMRAERQSQQQSAFERQQEKIAQLTRFIDRFKAKATKAKQAQSRVKALERMEKLAPVLAAREFSFEFQPPPSLPNPMLALRDITCGYRSEAGDIAIVHKVNASVLPGQRIGILGANGQGKSTLVKTLAGAQPALSGQITEGKGLAIGYFAQQELDVLRPDEGPLAHMIRLAKQVSPQAREQELRDFIGRFNFSGDMATQPVGTMSGGEKARLVLALLVWQRPNLLLLDEPTNHLDLTTREALSVALNEFEGTVMLVSHDRALLREVCDEFWLVAGGALRPFDGDLDDYQRWLQEQAREQARAAAEARQATPAATTNGGGTTPDGGNRKDERKAQAQARQRLAEQTKPLKAEMGKIETRLAAAQSESEALTATLSSGSLTGAERAEQGRKLKQLGDEIEALETRWLDITDQIEQITAAQNAG